MRTLVAVATVVVLAACSSGGGSKPAAKLPPITMRGEVTINGSANVRGSLSRCSGAGPYIDVFPGAAVVVGTAKGQPVRVGTITVGSGTNTFQGFLDQCTLGFTVTIIPHGDYYWLYIARQIPRLIANVSIVAGNGTIQIRLNSNTDPIPGG